MARVWQMGFESRDPALLTPPGTFVVSSIAGGGYCARSVPGTIYVGDYHTWIGHKTELWYRMYLKGGQTDAAMMIRDDLGSDVLHVRRDGRIWVLGVLKVNLDDLWELNSWTRLEFHIKMHNTLGIITVWQNGNQVYYMAGDTENPGAAYLGVYRWYSGSTYNLDLDDMAINDGVDDGRGNDLRPGPGHIVGCRPCSFPGVEAWTPVPAAGAYPDGNWARVDDGVPDDITTYVHSDTPGTIDYHVTENLPASTYKIRVGCVATNLRMRLAIVGAGEVQPYSARDGHFQTGDAIALSAAWDHYQQMVPTEPNGGEWTKALFDNTQFGYRDAS